MSYEILKYVSFKKKEQKIVVTSACNNCHPITYSKWEYGKPEDSFEQRIENLFVSLINGNFNGGQKKVKEIYEGLRRIKQVFAPNTSFEKDCDLKLERDEKLNHLVARLYAVPAILTGKTAISKDIIEKVKIFDEESVHIYNLKEKEYADMGWIITCSSTRSDVFPGWNLFKKREGYGSGYVLAEHSCYEQAKPGFCNTRAGRMIEIPDMGDFYWGLSYGWDRTLDNLKEYAGLRVTNVLTNPEFWKLFEGLKMGKLPYKDFPYEKYGFTRAKEVA